MAKVAPGEFKEIIAGFLSSQKHKQRYPHTSPASPFDNNISLEESESDDDEIPVVDTDGPNQPPRIAEWRANLVALSQTQNLYFAAYGDKIHVTIPRGLKQTLRGKPDLILDPPRSKEGRRIGGHIDRAHPHGVNHLIIGSLGALEILLLACDDGDVIAYYIHTIQAFIESGSLPQEARPFFHENVGISAWGLAIHEKSRLIAVSSNNREVVIFKYGCMSPASSKPDQISYQDFVAMECLDLPGTQKELFPTISQNHLIFRWNSLRKVLKLGPEGHNIPSIDFSSNSNGDADSVVAIDITGNLWILEIWGKEEVKRLPSIHKSSPRGNSYMGWGAIVLPVGAFIRTATPEEALGTPKLKEAVSRHSLGATNLDRHFDVTLTISDIKDSSKYHPVFGYAINGPVINEPVINLPGINEPILNGPVLTITQSTMIVATPAPHIPEERTVLQRPPISKDFMLTLPRLRHVDTFFQEVINKSFRNQSTKMTNLRKLAQFDNPMREQAQKMLDASMMDPREAGETEETSLVYHLQDRCAILRTYQEDVELIPPVATMPRTICRQPLKQTMPGALAHQMHFERLVLHAVILELGLVLIGSQVGRVALISLTRPEDSFSQHGPVTLFRVEGILPTKTQEDEKLRPHVPLLGMAASPLQGQTGERRRWRLILQYYDHSVLSYELRREGEDLLVF